MNVRKANLLVSELYALPKSKSTIRQQAIFGGQQRLYATKNESIAVLNSFPIFVYDYFNINLIVKS